MDFEVFEVKMDNDADGNSHMTVVEVIELDQTQSIEQRQMTLINLALENLNDVPNDRFDIIALISAKITGMLMMLGANDLSEDGLEKLNQLIEKYGRGGTMAMEKAMKDAARK